MSDTANRLYLARRKATQRTGEVPGNIVLAAVLDLEDHRTIREFATWWENADTGAMYDGRYFGPASFREAVTDYDERR